MDQFERAKQLILMAKEPMPNLEGKTLEEWGKERGEQVRGKTINDHIRYLTLTTTAEGLIDPKNPSTLAQKALINAYAHLRDTYHVTKIGEAQKLLQEGSIPEELIKKWTDQGCFHQSFCSEEYHTVILGYPHLKPHLDYITKDIWDKEIERSQRRLSGEEKLPEDLAQDDSLLIRYIKEITDPKNKQEEKPE